MVESEASELSEEEMLGAVKFGHDQAQVVIDGISEFANEIKVEKLEIEKKDFSDLKSKISKAFSEGLSKVFSEPVKKERNNLLNITKEKCLNLFKDDETYTQIEILEQFHSLEKEIVRTKILKKNKRIDGRNLDEIRSIHCDVGILPRAHGSSLFTRGETQALVAATLGTTEDEQRVEGLDGLNRERFMLHYNFPPFSVGETGRIGTG